MGSVRALVVARRREAPATVTPDPAAAENRRGPFPLPGRWAALVAVVAGLLGTWAFPQIGVWPLAFLSVAGLSLAVEGQRPRRAGWIGYLYGVAFFAPLLHWTGIFVGPVPWLFLALAEAAFMAGLGAVLALVQRLPAAPVWIAAAWVLQEAARDRLPFGGFPWGRLAFSQADSPLRWFAALGGQPLLTFAVALTGAAVAAGVIALARRELRIRTGLAIGVCLLVLVTGGGLGYAANHRPAGRAPLTIAVVQGSVPDLGLDFETRAREVLDNHVNQTLKLADEVRAGTVRKPSLVIWPENASDVDPFQDRSAYDEIQRAVTAIGVPVLVGAILQGPGPTHRRNAGILWSPVSGPGQQYLKRHPVPFAEYIPLRSVARLFSKDVDLVTQDMVPGHSNGLLRGGPVPIGDVICFEVAYDDLVRSSVLAGAQLLVVQSNNATFGHTSETYQQLAMARLRAIETDRVVVQSTTTGKSAIIDRDGRVLQQSGPLYRPDLLVSEVTPNTRNTPATRLGMVPEVALSLLALAGLVVAIVRQRRTRPAAGAPEPAPSEELAASDD